MNLQSYQIDIILIILLIELLYLLIVKSGFLNKIIKMIISSRYYQRSIILKNFFKTSVLPVNVKPWHLVAVNLSIILYTATYYKSLDLNPVVLIVTLVFFEVLILIYLKLKSQSDYIEKMLPTMLYIFARTYKINPNIEDSIRAVHKNLKDPMQKDVFVEIIKRIDIGVPPVKALEDVLLKYKNPKIKVIINLIKLSNKTGIDLSKMLFKIGIILEKEAKTRKEVKNIMFQTKASSFMTSLMVPIIVLMLLLLSQNYFNVLLNTASGRLVLIVSLFWYLIGVYMVNKILKDASYKV